MAKLTVATVNALKPTDRVYEHMDPEHPGFGVRVHTSGSKSFIYRYRINGRLRRYQLGEYPATSLSDAFDDYRDARKKTRNGSDPLEERIEEKRKDKQPTKFGDLANLYIDKHASKKRTGDEDVRILNYDILPKWKKRDADSIKKRDVIALIDSIVERNAPIQANRTLSLVRKIFNWALEKDLLDASPCFGVKAPSKENSKDRVLSDKQIRELFTLDTPPDQAEKNIHSLSLNAHSVFMLQLMLGQRVGEITGMRWDEIDFEKKVWELPASRAKNNMVHTIPLTTPCIEILEQLHLLRDPNPDTGELCEYVFPSYKGGPIRSDSIATSLARALKARKHAHYSPHDLRRTAATRISGLGTSREVLRQILNHKDQSVTARYDKHRYDNEKRIALEAWEREINQIRRGTSKAAVVVPIK